VTQEVVDKSLEFLHSLILKKLNLDVSHNKSQTIEILE
jgi:hypothetical protein